MNIEPLIVKKRDRGSLSDAEISSFVTAFTRGEVPEYQTSALLMAIVLRGMDEEETIALTRAMAESGEMLDLAGLEAPTIDKHSTGGVGDSTTLIVAPLLAAMGFAVPKLSGRGLGFTGGTLDKLEAVPGFRVDLTSEELVEQVRRIGVAIAAQSVDMVPADRALYALRDVTGTVPSIPLITSSILSKKIAAGAGTIVIDVKFGDGAFMPDLTSARLLSDSLKAVGAALGRTVTTVISRMDEPLSPAVGNALEMRHAILVLGGRIHDRLADLSLHLTATAAHAADPSRSLESWQGVAAGLIEDGRALDRFRTLVQSQGGDVRVVDDTDLLGWAPFTQEVRASHDGFVNAIPARAVGEAARSLGAGRAALGDVIDSTAGVVLSVDVGDQVAAGQLVATLHTGRKSQLRPIADELETAIVISEVRPFENGFIAV